MLGNLIDLVAAVVATAVVLVAPGAALLAATRTAHRLPTMLVPAASVIASVLLAAPMLALTLSMHWSIRGFGLSLLVTTLVLVVVGLLGARSRTNRRTLRERLRDALPLTPPALVLVVLGIFDAPQVRSDTFWHVALVRKLGELDSLSSARIAFEAGASGNANYPLPVFHALTALAAQAPRVEEWAATWFMTLWLAPVAMLAFGAMAAALVGDRRAGLVGSWTFTTIVVLGYGPWFFATRYLSYPGQMAIVLALPVIAWAIVRVVGSERRERAAALAIAALATVAIGVLHGNYVLYPALLAGGGAALLLVGNRERVGAALLATAAVVVSGGAVLAAQLPWLTGDDNFLRGTTAPIGEPTAFIRHRDVFTGSLDSFHVELGSLATQPWLVIGALALPVLLWIVRRCPGPWIVAGGAVAMVVFARTPLLVAMLDKAGSVTPVTRLDRVYPAAIGVVAVMLGIGWLLAKALERRPALGIATTGGTLVGLAAGTWWLDTLRDTRRIVVTPFVEARWVGGLDPSGLPRAAVYVATIATIIVALAVRFRVPARELWPSLASPDRSLRHLLASAAIVAVAVGLAPATVDRAGATWQPQAYDRAARNDSDFVRIEVYPAPVRRALDRFETGSIVLASFAETRKVASLQPVQSVEESLLREIDADPPADRAAARSWLTRSFAPFQTADYLVAARSDEAFAPIVQAALACGWKDRSAGGLWILERDGDRCAAPQVDQT
jgi:hypothetical protein